MSTSACSDKELEDFFAARADAVFPSFFDDNFAFDFGPFSEPIVESGDLPRGPPFFDHLPAYDVSPSSAAAFDLVLRPAAPSPHLVATTDAAPHSRRLVHQLRPDGQGISGSELLSLEGQQQLQLQPSSARPMPLLLSHGAAQVLSPGYGRAPSLTNPRSTAHSMPSTPPITPHLPTQRLMRQGPSAATSARSSSPIRKPSRAPAKRSKSISTSKGSLRAKSSAAMLSAQHPFTTELAAKQHAFAAADRPLSQHHHHQQEQRQPQHQHQHPYPADLPLSPPASSRFPPPPSVKMVHCGTGTLSAHSSSANLRSDDGASASVQNQRAHAANAAFDADFTAFAAPWPADGPGAAFPAASSWEQAASTSSSWDHAASSASSWDPATGSSGSSWDHPAVTGAAWDAAAATPVFDETTPLYGLPGFEPRLVFHGDLASAGLMIRGYPNFDGSSQAHAPVLFDHGTPYPASFERTHSFEASTAHLPPPDAFAASAARAHSSAGPTPSISPDLPPQDTPMDDDDDDDNDGPAPRRLVVAKRGSSNGRSADVNPPQQSKPAAGQRRAPKHQAKSSAGSGASAPAPLPGGSSQHPARSPSHNPAHARTASTASAARAGAAGAASSARGARAGHTPSTSASSAEAGFVNFTPSDSRRILTGVAPSGSSKTKARREREATERRRRLSEAAAKAVREAGGDVEGLRREGVWEGLLT